MKKLWVWKTKLKDTHNDKIDNNKTKWSISKILMMTVLSLTLGFGVYCSTIWCFSPSWYQVIGISMFPNLLDGDNCLIVNSIIGIDLDIAYNDIVIFEDNNNEKFLVKRVVGLPGDNIVVKGGLLFINGKQEQLPSLLLSRTDGAIDLDLGHDEYYVLGDNRKDSHDSRFFGPISREQIEGIVYLKWRSATVH